MKIRIIKENTQPFEGKTKYFLKENVIEIDIGESYVRWLFEKYQKNPVDLYLRNIADDLEHFLKEKLNIE